MKVFLDTEFSSLRKMSSRLISIGLVAEDGRELYAEMPRHTWVFKCSYIARSPELRHLYAAMRMSLLEERAVRWAAASSL